MSRQALRRVKYTTSHAFQYIHTHITKHLRGLKVLCSRWGCSCPSGRMLQWCRRLPLYLALLPVFVSGVWAKMQLSLTNISKTRFMVALFGFSSNLVLLTALGVGLYTRWYHTGDPAILLIAFTGLFVLSISACLVYYFSRVEMGMCLSRLYIGCVLGVVSFTEHSSFNKEVSEELMNVLLTTSLLMRCVWSVVVRVVGSSGSHNTGGHQGTNQDPVIINSMDGLEMVGVATASVVLGKEVLPVSLLLLSLLITISSIRLKSFLGVLNLAFLVIISGVLYFPKLLHLTANPFALVCFAGRMSFEPIVDLYWSPLTTLERWRPLLFRRTWQRRVLILLVFSIQMCFLGVNATQIPQHKEWFIVVPIFTAFGFVWLCYHLVFFATCWLLSNKISTCVATYVNLPVDSRNFNQIMAAKGVRHFSLISKRLVLVTVVMTVILGAVGWNTKTALSISLLCMVIPAESAIMSLLWEMGSSLGGTCVGYALVAPALTVRPGTSASLLPTDTLHTLSSRATHILNTVQRFFSYHLIDTYGCDYSSSGLTAGSVNAKLKAFFNRDTLDGPGFDTYILYYSGPVYENGDWALAGDDVYKVDDIMTLWEEKRQGDGNRLILVCDTEHSYRWCRLVRRLRKDYVTLQTYMLTSTQPKADRVEDGVKTGIGSFTSDWMDYNSARVNEESDVHDKDRQARMMYAVSRAWPEFTFHLPTQDDIVQHWNANFPKVTRPLIKVTNFSMNFGVQLCWCCEIVLRCLRRFRMNWFPPLEYDTGHGFKLINT